MLDNRRYSDFVQTIDELNPVDAADFFSRIEAKRIPTVFKLLTKDNAADIFAELDSDIQKRIIEALSDRETSAIIEELALDDAVDALSELPANIVARIMKNVTSETRAEINRLLAYPEYSAGSIMTAEYIGIHAKMSVAQAVEYIRLTGINKETVYVAYVTDESRVLEGTVSFKELLFANPQDLIGNIMTEDPIYAATVDDQEYVADTIAKYGLLALPIVDKEKRLVGIVTVDDAIDVINEEATEDIEIMAAITPTDKPYMKTGVFETWKKRFPWLLVLMLAAIFSSAVITHYENAIGTYAILTVFFPMLMNTGGNAGSQSSVAIIRAMSLGEITMKNFMRVIWKEFRVSVLCGICLAIVCFVKTMLIDFRLQAETVLENGAVQDNLKVAAIVSATAFFAVVVAKVVGTILPMLAKKIKLDPAVMASPFITTIVDTVTLVIYFSIASQALGL
ncbi:MAG: magnesium transporter [Clostridia bacterium]|nr:magnesium transporter [Clostridia bacterium]